MIGADPHKRSVTIEVIDVREQVLHKDRYGTDPDGHRQMLAAARRFAHRRWAVEGSNGIGRHVAQRLVADGVTVIDVPAKLAARARVFDTGNGRKTDPADAHSVAVVALRTPHLTVVRPEVWASPGLVELMADLPADQLADRFPGPVTTELTANLLESPDELVAVIGRSPTDPSMSDERPKHQWNAAASLTPTKIDNWSTMPDIYQTTYRDIALLVVVLTALPLVGLGGLAYAGLRIVTIIEPNSLPNLVTHTSPRSQVAFLCDQAHQRGIYLSAIPARAGWSRRPWCWPGSPRRPTEHSARSRR